MSKPVRVVVVGAGAMGNNHSRSISMNDGMELVAVVDIDSARAEDVARRFGGIAFTDIEAAIEATAPDGIVIATTTAAHFDTARNIIERGLPVFVEKPITDVLDTTRELVDLSASKGVPIMCGFVERFNPAVRTALGMLDEPMKHFMSVRHSPVNPRATASVVYDLLIHDIDLALAFHGRETTMPSVASVLWVPAGSPVDEISDCLLKFGDGSIASLSASRQGQRKVRDVRVVTDTHLFEVDLLRVNVTVYKNVMQDVVQSGGTSSYRAETVVDMPFVRHEGEPLALQMRHFRGLITGEIDPDAERSTLMLPHMIAEHAVSSSR